MEIELVTDKEAEEKPVGQGQEEPNQYPHLDAPKYVLRCAAARWRLALVRGRGW